MTTASNPYLHEAQAFVQQHLSTLSREIIEMQDAGEIGHGLLRELTRILQPFAGSNAQALAEGLVKRAALEVAAQPAAAPGPGDDDASLQERVSPWVLECLGEKSANDLQLRSHRFMEESVELVQSCGCTQDEVLQIVEWVYGRDVGEKEQEVGGVMITLAALCLAHGLDLHAEAETELARIWENCDGIRKKQEFKPVFGEGAGRVSVFEEGVRYADQYMMEILESECVPVEGNTRRFALACKQTELRALQDADEDLQNAISWLVRRGTAKVVGDAHGTIIELLP